MSSSRSRCQAKDPSACKYHGNHSERFTRVARERLLFARKVHQVSQSRSEEENLKAAESLKEAELSYYSTEEGRKSLLAHIDKSDNFEQRRIWSAIIQNADMKRELEEAQQSYSTPVPTFPDLQVPRSIYT